MSIGFVSILDVADSTNVTSVTQSVTINASTNCLIVTVGSSDSFGTQANITSMTFNGSALTQVRQDVNTPSPNWKTEIWRLVNPTVTTANLVINWDTTGGKTSGDRACGVSVLQFSGVDTASPIDTSTGASGTGTTLSVSITTGVADAWIVDCAVGRDDGGLTVGSGQTVRSDRTLGNPEGIGVSTVDGKAVAGAETMDWTQGSSVEWVITAVSLKPATGSSVALSGQASTLAQGTEGVAFSVPL